MTLELFDDTGQGSLGGPSMGGGGGPRPFIPPAPPPPPQTAPPGSQNNAVPFTRPPAFQPPTTPPPPELPPPAAPPGSFRIAPPPPQTLPPGGLPALPPTPEQEPETPESPTDTPGPGPGGQASTGPQTGGYAAPEFRGGQGPVKYMVYLYTTSTTNANRIPIQISVWGPVGGLFIERGGQRVRLVCYGDSNYGRTNGPIAIVVAEIQQQYTFNPDIRYDSARITGIVRDTPQPEPDPWGDPPPRAFRGPASPPPDYAPTFDPFPRPEPFFPPPEPAPQPEPEPDPRPGPTPEPDPPLPGPAQPGPEPSEEPPDRERVPPPFWAPPIPAFEPPATPQPEPPATPQPEPPAPDPDPPDPDRPPPIRLPDSNPENPQEPDPENPQEPDPENPQEPDRPPEESPYPFDLPGPGFQPTPRPDPPRPPTPTPEPPDGPEAPPIPAVPPVPRPEPPATPTPENPPDPPGEDEPEPEEEDEEEEEDVPPPPPRPCLYDTAQIKPATMAANAKIDRVILILEALSAALGIADLTVSNNILDGVNQANQKLDTINTKLGPQVDGGISGYLKKFWNSLNLSRLMSVLNFAIVLHNAYMLSNTITQTLFGAMDNILQIFGVDLKDADDNDISVSQFVGNAIESLAQSILGVETVDGIQQGWAKFNRIYQAGANIIYSFQSISYSVLEGLETVGNYVAKIGNAARKFGVFNERAFSWMNQNLNFMNSRFFNGLNNIQEAVEAIDTVSSEVLNITQTVDELQDQTTKLAQELNFAETTTTNDEIAADDASQGSTVSASDEGQ